MSGETVSRRLVLFFPGFEPLDAAAHYRRFARAAEMTAKVWEQSIEVGPLSEGEGLPSFDLKNGPVKTRFVICDLAPVMTEISKNPFAIRIARGLYAVLSFILNGTFFSYLRTSWRYGAFFLYPLLMLVAMIGVSVLAGHIAGTLTGLVEFAFLFALACRYAHFLLMMDLWHYARMLALGGENPGLELTTELLQKSQSLVQEEIAQYAPDEVVLVGHSIGAALAVELADILARQKLAAPVHLMTLGSGFLQVACHPKAKRFYDMAKNLLTRQVHWLDVQALIDPINFLHSDLAKLSGVAPGNYREIIIRMRHLLSETTYQRIKFNCFRVHRQYVLPVELKQKYSFHMMMAGPTAFPEIVRLGGLPETEIGVLI